MINKEKNPWNKFEIAKLVIPTLTPLLLFSLALFADNLIQKVELARKRSEAVQEFSRFIYERHSRSTLLLSALRRHTQCPVPESKQEVVERKRLYDEAYFNWNTHLQANLLLVRQILGSSEYSKFEAIVELQLVKEMFTPIDTCLTEAYDLTIRGGNPDSVLADCKASELIQRALNCGYAITDELFKLSSKGAGQKLSGPVVKEICPSDSPTKEHHHSYLLIRRDS